MELERPTTGFGRDRGSIVARENLAIVLEDLEEGCCTRPPACCRPCLSCIFMFLVICTSAGICWVRQYLFDTLTTLDTVEAIQFTRVYREYMEYVQELIADGELNPDLDYDNPTGNCSYSSFTDILESNSSTSCLYDWLASNAGNLSAAETAGWDGICSSKHLLAQYHGSTDETYCGINSFNMQGCQGAVFASRISLPSPPTLPRMS